MEPNEPNTSESDRIEMPAPTSWPLLLAAGIALLGLGLLTSLAISAIGLVLLVISLAAWVRLMLPGMGMVEEPRVSPAERWQPIRPSRKRVTPLAAGMPGHRMRMPEKVHPYSAGVKGGLAGGAVMAVVALAYGLLSGRGFFYPINLLAAMLLPGLADKTAVQLEHFSLAALVTATLIHLALSLGVGLFFGVLLPTLPRSPVFWGGIVGPLLWTAGIYGFMRILNPVMNQYVDWPWFIASQFAFGLTMGIVVVRSERVPAEAAVPLPEKVTDTSEDDSAS